VRNDRLDLPSVGHVAAQGKRFCAGRPDFRGDVLGRLQIARSDDHGRACCSRGQRHASSNPLGRPGQEHRFAAQHARTFLYPVVAPDITAKRLLG